MKTLQKGVREMKNKGKFNNKGKGTFPPSVTRVQTGSEEIDRWNYYLNGDGVLHDLKGYRIIRVEHSVEEDDLVALHLAKGEKAKKADFVCIINVQEIADPYAMFESIKEDESLVQLAEELGLVTSVECADMQEDIEGNLENREEEKDIKELKRLVKKYGNRVDLIVTE